MIKATMKVKHKIKQRKLRTDEDKKDRNRYKRGTFLRAVLQRKEAVYGPQMLKYEVIDYVIASYLVLINKLD